MTNLTLSLPLSQNLRELRYKKLYSHHPRYFKEFYICLKRLEWFHQEDESEILDIVKSLSEIRSLERVVLLTEFIDPLENVEASLQLSKSMNLPDFFVKFVSGLPRLVALSLFCFQLDTSDLEEIYLKLAELILPSRPSFWFKIGSRDTKPDFGDAPQTHRYGIVECGNPPRCRPRDL